jgi:hypothetical protein
MTMTRDQITFDYIDGLIEQAKWDEIFKALTPFAEKDDAECIHFMYIVYEQLAMQEMFGSLKQKVIEYDDFAKRITPQLMESAQSYMDKAFNCLRAASILGYEDSLDAYLGATFENGWQERELEILASMNKPGVQELIDILKEEE